MGRGDGLQLGSLLVLLRIARHVESLPPAIEAALSAIDHGHVVGELASLRIGASEPIALHRVDKHAGVLALTRTDRSDYIATGVVLREDDRGSWELPQRISGVAWHWKDPRRPTWDWPSWGPVFGLSTGGWAAGSGDETGPMSALGETPPDAAWKWVFGVAARRIVAVEARSSLGTSRNPVDPRTGAFIVLVRAQWSEQLSYQGIADDGGLVSLRHPGGAPPVPGS